MRVNFISGLPRSGSTLLSAILSQNPRIRASMSSPVGPMIDHMLQFTGIRSQWSPLISNDQKKRIIASIIQSYYSDISDEEIILDTNRLWCSRMSLINEIEPQARVIACVREVKWIFNSFELIYQKNPLLRSKLFNGEQSQTVFSRIDALASADGVIGYALRALKEAYFGEYRNKLILVDYEALINDPIGTIDALYVELRIPSFRHDFEHISFDGGKEFDSHFGLPGLHSVEPRLRCSTRRMILPPEIVQRFAHQDFWSVPQSSVTDVRAILANGKRHEAK